MHSASEPGSSAPDPRRLPLGAILAGGASRRFGSPKALAEVGGLSLIRRVRDALGAAIPDPVLITSEPERYATLRLPSRPDSVSPGGPLAGLHAALLWARERRRHGALVVACDLPFLAPPLLRLLVRRAAATPAEAIVPEGPGRFGVEPLCAWYGCALIPRVEAALREGRLAPGELLLSVDAERVALEEVRRIGDPDILFHNVNTKADRQRAERIAGGSEAPDGTG